MSSYPSTSSWFDSQAPTTRSPLPRPILTSPRYNPFPDVPGNDTPKSPRDVWANVTQSPSPTVMSPLPCHILTSPRYNPFPDVPGDDIPKSPRDVWANVTQSPSSASPSPTSHITIHEPRPIRLASPVQPQPPSPPSERPTLDELLAFAERFIESIHTEERKKAGVKKVAGHRRDSMIGRHKRSLERLRRQRPSPSPGPSKRFCNCPDHCQQHKGTSPQDAIIIDADDEPSL